jgi:hypothetical protein
VKIKIIQDKYNQAKTWLVKKCPNQRYELSQAINGKRLYAFEKTSLENIKGIVGLEASL